MGTVGIAYLKFNHVGLTSCHSCAIIPHCRVHIGRWGVHRYWLFYLQDKYLVK